MGGTLRTQGAGKAWKVAATALSLVLSACLGEWILRETAWVATWSERNGGQYLSPFSSHLGVPFLLTSGRPNSAFTFDQTEFDFAVHINRHGVRDVEHPRPPRANELRLLFLGDSFTMGQGAAFADSYPQQLGAMIAPSLTTKAVRVVQAGVSGSDPVFGFELLRRSLLVEEPDWVILAINGSDIGDVIARGGLDRFTADGQLRADRAPWWEDAFADSHLVRAIAMHGFGLNWFLMTRDQMREAEGRARDEILRTILAMAKLGEEHGFRLVVASHPFAYEVEGRAPLSVSEFQPIYQSLRRNGVPVIDLYDHFRAQIDPPEIAQYFWPLDQHCTAAGYQVFASGVLAGLTEIDGFPRPLPAAAAIP